MGTAIAHTLLGLLAVAAVFVAAGLGVFLLTSTPLARPVTRPVERAPSIGTRQHGHSPRLARRPRH